MGYFIYSNHGNKFIVDKNDPRVLSGELVHVNTGNTQNVGKIYVRKDGKSRMVNKEQLEEYLNNGWEKGNTCKGRISPTKGMIHIYKGQKEMMVSESESKKYLDAGWTKGRLVSPSAGKIIIHKNGIDKYCTKDELQTYLNDGWERGGRSRNKGLTLRVNKVTCEYVMLSKDDPRYNDPNYIGNATYKGSPSKGTKYMHKEGVTKRIKLENVENYIKDGWRFGADPIWCNNRKK